MKDRDFYGSDEDVANASGGEGTLFFYQLSKDVTSSRRN